MTSALQVAYDDVTIGLIPPDAPVIIAYVDGRFANDKAARRAFPHATILTITVTGRPGARFCDCETGDLTPGGAARWAHDELHAGRKPGIYGAVSSWPAIMAQLRAFDIARPDILVWTAHLAGAHICAPNTCAYPGFLWTANGTQWTFNSHERNLDESLVDQTFIGTPPPSAPRPEDPHHYGWYAAAERGTVERYDQLRRRPFQHRPRLATLRTRLSILAGDLATQAEEDGRWPSHGAWRYLTMLRRADGQRLA